MRLTALLYGAPKGLSHRTKFIDRLRLYVKGGAGGQGYPKYGGMGGDGGDVVFVASEKSSLFDLVTKYPKKRFIAEAGQESKRMQLLGGCGAIKEVEVPRGVVISTDDGKQLGELNEPGESLVVASGGQGGGPHNNFKATRGDSRSVRLDLKLLADIGLVGFPNAGKSTFLKAVSRTQPKIADYPFTTIRPHLGTMMYQDGRRITVADLPGLIEGAHLNLGMGHFFLKHIERTKLLLIIVDINGFALNPQSPFRNPFETTILLNKELEMYKEAVLDKPQVLLLNKMDCTGSQLEYDRTVDMLSNLKEHLHIIPEELRPRSLFNFSSVFPMSAAEGDNIEPIKGALRDILDESERDKDAAENLRKHILLHNSEKAESRPV